MKDPVEETIRIYNELADEWAKRYGKIDFMQDFAEIFTGYIKGKKILDLGCGPGRDAKFFTENGYNVVGIDLCDSFLEAASKNAPKAVIKKMDFRNLDFPSKSFDGVWASAAIYHVPKNNARETIININKVLKSGGVLYISLLKGVGQKFLEEDFGKGRFFKYYTKEEIEELLKECGFEIIEIYPSTGQLNLVREWLNIFAIKK
jgi:SAM-dependent methyltransferase